jgi:hypothetical protein
MYFEFSDVTAIYLKIYIFLAKASLLAFTKLEASHFVVTAYHVWNIVHISDD